MPSVKIKHVVEDQDRHGNVRIYYRIKGQRKIRLRGPAGSEEFWEDYRAAQKGALQPKKERGAAIKGGTFQWLCAHYFANCDDFKAASAGWKTVRRRHLDLVSEKYGHLPYTQMERRHIIKIRDELKDTPGGKNNLVKHIRGLFNWAIECDILNQNSTDKIKRIKVRKPYHTATVDEIRQYLEFHKPGTKAYLGLALALYTGLRVSDLARVGRQHIRDGYLSLTPAKTSGSSGVKIEIPILSELQSEIDRLPTTQLIIIAKDDGTPYGVKSLSNLYKKWFVKAGLPDCSVHSLRKGGATIAAINGATANELSALFGWTTLDQPARYTEQANRRKLAENSAHLLRIDGVKP